MKKFLILLTIMVFLMVSSFAFACEAVGGGGDKIHHNNINVPIAVAGAIAGAQATIEKGAVKNIFGDINSHNTSIDAPIPATQQFGPVIGYSGQPTPSEGYQSIDQLIMYSCWFTEGALESMLKGGYGTEAEFKIANENIAAAKLADDGKTKWIKIVISRDKYAGANAAFKGFVTARSNDRRNTMVEVVAKAALSAMKNGCNVIHFTAQGAVRDVMSSGWGIGFNTTQAQVYSNDMGKSNVSSGGMGYSRAQAGVRDLPWLQGFGLVDNNLEYPPVKGPVAE